MNDYRTMRDKQQKEFDAFPIGAAFNNEQFSEMMARWGLNAKKKSDLKQVVSLYAGTFLLKKDVPAFKEMTKRHRDEFEAAVAADQTGDGFIYQMFYDELCNHEYGYTGDTTDTLDALGYTLDEVLADERLAHGLEKATHQIMEQEDCFG